MNGNSKSGSTWFDLGVGLQRSFEQNCATLYRSVRQGLSDADGRELPGHCWQETLAWGAALRPWLIGWQVLADTQAGYLAQAWLRGQRQLGEQREQIGRQLLDVWLAGLDRLEPPGPFATFERLLALTAPLKVVPARPQPPLEAPAAAEPGVHGKTSPGRSRVSTVDA